MSNLTFKATYERILKGNFMECRQLSLFQGNLVKRILSRLNRSLLLILCCAAVLFASSGVLVLISTNQVSNDGNNGARFEPTSAVGSTTWALGWNVVETGNSFFSAWNGSSWNAPQQLRTPDFNGLIDLNLAWDSFRNRFVFVAIDAAAAPHNVWYGYSTNSSGSQWQFSATNTAVLSNSLGNWDYPSVAVDTLGRVIVGAVKLQSCPPPDFQCPIGYYSVLSNDGDHFSLTPSPIIASGGAQSRLIATDNRFEAFVPTLDAQTHLPTYIARYESSDGVNWPGADLGIGMGAFLAPNNNTPPSASSIVLFYAPLLAAQGYTNGLWTVAFQANQNGFNNVIICTSDRGCGWVNFANNDEFLAGTSVSADRGYWIFYYAYLNPRNPPLITQAIYYPPGNPTIAATINTDIDPTSWTTLAQRCTQTCYAAGDFNTIASNPFAAASTPFIKQSIHVTDLFQNFVQDPAASANVPNFRPNFIPIPYGANVVGLGRPLEKGAFGLPPGLKVGIHP